MRNSFVSHERINLETASYGKDRMQLSLRKAVIETIAYSHVDFQNITQTASHSRK